MQPEKTRYAILLLKKLLPSYMLFFWRLGLKDENWEVINTFSELGVFLFLGGFFLFNQPIALVGVLPCPVRLFGIISRLLHCINMSCRFTTSACVVCQLLRSAMMVSHIGLSNWSVSSVCRVSLPCQSGVTVQSNFNETLAYGLAPTSYSLKKRDVFSFTLLPKQKKSI